MGLKDKTSHGPTHRQGECSFCQTKLRSKSTVKVRAASGGKQAGHSRSPSRSPSGQSH